MIKTKPYKALLTLQDVCFSYKKPKHQPRGGALNGVSFSMDQGEFFSILGPSGCGKSTLLRIIAGLQKPDSGQITFHTSNDEDIPKIGMVFQDLALFPHMSVARNIGFALRDMPRAKRRERIDEVLRLVNLIDKRGAYPHELSGGQKQRLALARSLAPNPSLILLDEPFASQDVSLKNKIRDDIISILKKANVAAILVTHDPEEAMHFADRLAIMKDGHIEQIGTAEEIYNNPINPFIASFFGRVNIVEGIVSDGGLNTPIGFIPTNNIEDGKLMTAVIRPDALSIRPHDARVDHKDPNFRHTHGYISKIKYLGQSSFVSLQTANIDKQDEDHSLKVYASVPGLFSPSSDDIHDIFLDESKILLFQKG